ncbi:MAG: hypothetical protein BZY81_03930 [SAR202 cluster bacterium Io17-Chloro-G4]|nr:MAG: hypothetical protein BZY81_03930 [SAR202 cluster bacterium Io17-Chloro-G4]
MNIFYGWWIVAIGICVDALKHGTFNRGFTLYVLPIRNELGIGIAAISLAEMLGRMEGGLQGPLLGWMTDRFGPRWILILGGITSGLGFILLSFTQSYLYFVLVFVGLLSLGFRAGYNNATMPAVNQWFQRRRALAMSVAGTGSALGGAAIAPLVGVLVFTTGWRVSALISGIVIIAVVIPLASFVRRSPESMGLRPDGDPPPDAETGVSSTVESREVETTEANVTRPTGNYPEEPDFTAREAMRTGSYWLLVWAVGLRNVVHSGMSFLLAPVIVWFLTGSGRTEDDSLPLAALFVGVMSFSALLMNPIMGWLGDKWSKQKLSAVAMIGGALSLIILLDRTGNIWQVTLFVFLLAFSETANPLAWAIMGDFFGRRSYATLRGWQHLPDQFMSMSTPVWMGVIVDQTGSYKWALIPLAVIYTLAAVSYLAIPRPQPPLRVRTRRAV